MQNEIIGDLFDDETPRAIPVRVVKIWRLCFMDKQGGYRERVYRDADKLAKACAKLGVEAEIKDAQGEKIGEVRDTHRTLEHIPGRRWAWYFDTQDESSNRTYFTD